MNRSELQIRIDEIADDFLKERRDGLAPKIDDYIKSNSDIAEPLRDFLKMILMVDDCAGESDFQSANQPRINEGSDDFPTIPDYEIIREVGRGGMGIVYEAQQLSLDRTVALKLLPASLFNHPQAIDRFELEAKSAAKLHHSHIVPVFDVGNQEDNRYYTMQFIEGQSLDHVIESIRALKGVSAADQKSVGLSETVKMGLSTTTAGRKPFYRNVATLGQRVANALDYAHENGIVHRDIKPSNLMLDPDNSVWIMDFGLAKTEESDLTHTGDVVGTIRYMSPERFAGQCDQRSDIYSLGMTLYELLSQCPAFGESNRLELIQAIKSDEPESLRKTDKQIPRDLETIVEKAINKDPRRRYVTAGELSSDLQRFVNGQPIRARRVGSVERLWLWTRKHKALAVSLAATALLLVSATVGSLWAAASFKSFGEEQKQLANTNLRLANENELKTKEAEAAALSSQRSLTIFTDSFSSTGPSAGGKPDMLAIEVLKNAQKRLLDSDLDGESQLKFLDSLSTSFIDLGEYSASVSTTQQALELSHRLYGESDRKTLAARSALASAYRLDGQLNEAVMAYEETINEMEAHLDPTDILLGKCLSNFAGVHNTLGQYEEALARYLEAQEVLADRLGDRERLALESNIAQCSRILGELEFSIESFRRISKEADEKLGEDDKKTLSIKYELAEALRRNGDVSEAIEIFTATLRLQKMHLGKKHPFTLQTMRSVGSAYVQEQKFELAAEALQNALEGTRETLGKNHPETLDALDALGELYLRLNNVTAENPILKELLERSRDTYGDQHQNTAAAINNLATNYYKQGKLEKSIPLFEEVVPLAQKTLGRSHPNTMMMILNLATNYSRDGREKESIPQYLDVYENSENPQVVEMAALGLLESYAKLEDAEAYVEQASDWIDRIGIESGERSERVAGYCAMAGSFLNSLEAYEDSERLLRRSVEIRQELIPDGWKFSNAKSALGEALFGLGDIEAAKPLLAESYAELKLRIDSIPEDVRDKFVDKARERFEKLDL